MSGVQPPFGRDYGRSMVIAQQGIVATSQVLASQAGAAILACGGSAADAAIAANAVLGVIEPMMNGIGGDLFVLYREARTRKLTGLNASGPAPRALSPELVAAHGIERMADAGIHAVTVPGVVDGWARVHKRFGRIKWPRLFEPAITYAEEGFPVPEVVASLWDAAVAAGKWPAAAPRVGEIVRNPGLAAAYRLIAADGPAAFYRGPVGEAILRTSQTAGGTMSREDLASYAAEWVEPISIDYRGWRVYELPPNGQGMAALEMLNVMEALPADPAGPDPGGPMTAAEVHKRIEAMKLAYADAHRYIADPRTGPVPVEILLSKEHARRRAAAINPARANGGVEAAEVSSSNTVYLTAVDREGNVASWIQSIFSSFGSGFQVDGMGFALQNRGAGFSLQEGHPNRLAGGKRPFHTIIPGFLERGDQHIGFGIMGGANQPLAHAQFVSNFVDYGMNLQQAMEAPRFFKNGPAGCDVAIESRVPEATLRRLSEMGHELTLRSPYSQEMGRGQAILHDSATRTNYAASDPRADGAAVPEPLTL